MRRVLLALLLYTWALPVTLAGWLLLLWARPTGVSWWEGPVRFVEVERHPWPGMAGLALGGVVLLEAPAGSVLDHGRRQKSLIFRERQFIAHELRHVQQVAVGGVLWALAYGIEFLRVWGIKGPTWHQHHWLERDARDYAAVAARRPYP